MLAEPRAARSWFSREGSTGEEEQVGTHADEGAGVEEDERW
jgi:hypothetical protein